MGTDPVSEYPRTTVVLLDQSRLLFQSVARVTRGFDADWGAGVLFCRVGFVAEYHCLGSASTDGNGLTLHLLGASDLSNVLPLSKTHHAAFDRRLFTIDQDYRLQVNPEFGPENGL